MGQAIDNGSTAKLTELDMLADRENVCVYALQLPLFGKQFVSDSFTLQGLGSQGSIGGYIASVELTKAIPAFKHASTMRAGTDPFSILTERTGGLEMHFRKQRELENGLMAMGGALRTTYHLTYTPDALTPGYHDLSVSVDVPNATVKARKGYYSDLK